MRGHRIVRPLLAALALSAAACSTEVATFEPGVDPWDVPQRRPQEWPEMPVAPDTVAVTAGERLATVTLPAHYWAHGRVLLSAPVEDVWAALQWRQGALVAVFPDVLTVECEPLDRPEPAYTLSYGVKETPKGGALYQANWFLVHWRAEPTRDATGALAKVNVKAQKVDGTRFISVMQQSVVATPAAGGGTVLEVVRQINAPGESATTAGDWIRLWVGALQAQLAGTRESLVPTSTCFPQAT